MSTTLRQLAVAVLAFVVLSLLVGVGYPAVVWGLGRIWAGNADGSYVTDASGAVVGSALIGQSFADDKGNALPQWFQSRPSAAGAGYDAMSSSASNLGPNDEDLLTAVRDRKAAAAALDGVAPGLVPPDALTASGSGLDPDISPAYAREQVARVAAARHLDPARVAALVEQHISGRTLGYFGQERVNVLDLNLALAQLG